MVPSAPVSNMLSTRVDAAGGDIAGDGMLVANVCWGERICSEDASIGSGVGSDGVGVLIVEVGAGGITVLLGSCDASFALSDICLC